MPAIDDLTSELVARGMDPSAAAILVARAMMEALTPKRSKEAQRAFRYRQRQKQRDEITTRHDEKTAHKRDESVTNRDGVTRTNLSIEKDSSSRRATSRRRSALPDAFLLSEKMGTYAQANGFDSARTAREFDRFCNHHRAKGSLFVDWEAAWRTWVSNALEYSRRNSGGTQGGFRWNGGIEGVT
jgi:hypothetical protein